MQVPALNATIIMSLALLLGGVYGIVAGKQRLRILILSVYVGIVLSEQLTSALAPSVQFLSREQVGWTLLGIPIVIFGFFGVMHAKNHSKGVFIANVIVGLLTVALIMSSVMHQMPPSQLEWLNRESFIALNLHQFHPWLVGLLPLVALLLGFMKNEKGH